MDYAKIDAFWQETIDRARRVPLAATCEQVIDKQPYLTYRVTYRSFGGAEIVAFLAVPGYEQKNMPLPVIVTAPGYGGWEQGVTLGESLRGYIVMQIFPRGQGESGDQPRYQQWKGEGFLLRGIDQPEGYYYQGGYMDMLRGVDYLLTRDDVDPARLGAMGTSQGGAIVLAAAALDPRIQAVVAHVPSSCDMRHNRALGIGELGTPEHLDTYDYFDPVTLAERLQAPTLLSSGGKDVTCPAETIQAVYDRLPGIKSLAHFPDLPHASSLEFYQMSWLWMDMYLRQKR